MFESFQYRDFRWLWMGGLVSFMAMNMQMITRGWLVLRLQDDSPLALALVMLSFAAPQTFVSLIGGALADRLPRKYMVIVSQSGNALMTLLLGILDFTGVIEFWHVLLIGVGNGSMMAFNMPSRAAIVTEIVPERSLVNAISLNNSGMNLTRIIGPALAGFLIVFIDTSGVFFIVTGIYVFAVLSMFMVKAGSTAASRSRKSIAGDIKAGIGYAFSDARLKGLVLLALISTLFGFSFWALMPAWAREALNVQSDGLGMLMMIMGVGALAGTLGLAGIRNLKFKGRVLLASCLIWGVALAIFSQLTSYAAAVPFLLVIGVVSSLFMSLNMTLLQVLAAPEMRGRMTSINMMTFGAMPLSSLPFGAAAERIGTPDALMISGILLGSLTLIFALSNRTFRNIQ
ncbi:MAG: hypothetical protein CL694_12330 [Chloroflexi bacterium]|jgi:MFS family permease|nr:hypothetical protein [Chloroflexota bacterium]HAL48507.1 hypothetical protein [Dehalococcoidia bacterium]|tara:strand:- start:17 stop:1216 length:1200 start_codon:yes stop_codon:yes gene_type:complete